MRPFRTLPQLRPITSALPKSRIHHWWSQELHICTTDVDRHGEFTSKLHLAIVFPRFFKSLSSPWSLSAHHVGAPVCVMMHLKLLTSERGIQFDWLTVRSFKGSFICWLKKQWLLENRLKNRWKEHHTILNMHASNFQSDTQGFLLSEHFARAI